MLDGSILKELVQQYSGGEQRTPLNFGVYYKNTLVALCHALEDCILASDCEPLVIAAFQQGKWYLEEADRYGAIADHADQIVIMAAPETGFHSHDTSQRDNVALVDLDPSDPVSQEWHLMILSSQYTAMVLCQELTPEEYQFHGAPSNDLERKFYGFWTFDPALVRFTVEQATRHIGRYNSDLQQTLENKTARILAANPELSEATSTQGVSRVVSYVLDYLEARSDQLKETHTFDLPNELQQNLVSNELQAFLRMAHLVDIMDPQNPMAGTEVASLLEMMGQLADLPGWRLQRLRLAGWLHRIAPLQPDQLPDTESPSCPLVPGAQVLRRMPRLRAVAQIITHQSEWWDGSGQPAGLSGDLIPLESRMLGLASYFQSRVATQASDDREAVLTAVLEDCRQQQGKRWDPKLVDILGLIVTGLQQGLSLPNIPMKASLGTGLLNPEVEAWDAPNAFPQSSSV